MAVKKYDRCFYLESINAKLGAVATRFMDSVQDWRHEHSRLYWDSTWAAWHCHNAKKRNRVYKHDKRRLIDLWWTVYYLWGLKLNGLDLGHLYLKLEAKGNAGCAKS